MPDELKTGDDVVLRGKVVYVMDERLIEVKLTNGKTMIISPERVRKVRPGTYEVTAREVAKMMVRACLEFKIWLLFCAAFCNRGKLMPPNFKTLRRWVHCRLRELRRKRGGR